MKKTTYYYWNGQGSCSSDTYACSLIVTALFVDPDWVKGCYKLVDGKRVPCMEEFLKYVEWCQKHFKIAERRGGLVATKK